MPPTTANIHHPRNTPSASFAPWMAALFIASFAVYISTAPPEFLFDDNPEFISSSHVLGVCHPPGYPLFSIAGKLFANLAPSAIPLGVNLLSAFAAALGVALFARVLWKLTSRIPVAVVFSIFFMLSRTFWSQASQAEVYAPNILLTAALLNIVIDLDSGWDFRLPALAAALSGFAILNHYTAFLIVPVAAVYIILARRDKIPPAAYTAAVVAILFLVSLTALAYLPLRSAADPQVNWGDTHTAAGFFRHIKGVETMGKASRVLASEKLKFIIDYAKLATRQAPWPCFLLLIPGAVALYKRKARGALIAVLAAATVFGFLFTLNYLFGPRASYVVSFFYITSFFIMFIIIGLGAAELLSLLPPGGKSPALEKGILLIPAALICAGAASSLRFVYKSQNRIAPNYGKNILRTLERDSAIFSFDITESFPLMALRSLYGMRQDALLFGKPGDTGATSKSSTANGSVADPARAGAQSQLQLLQTTGAARRVYLTIGAVINQPSVYPVVDGLLYSVRFSDLKYAPPDKWPLYDMSGLSMDEPRCAGGTYDYLTCYVVSKYYLLQAAGLLQRKEEGLADRQLKKLVTFNPDSQFLRLSLATLYLHTGRIEDALAEYIAASKLPPEEVESSLTGLSIYNNAGELYRYKKQWNSSIKAFEKARDISPDDYFTRFQLGRAHNEYAEWLTENGQPEEASDECKSSIIELEKAAALGAGSDSLYTGLAWCSEQLGDNVKASKYYHKAVSEGDAKKGQERRPYSQNYYKAGEFYSSKLRKFPEAAAMLEKYLVVTPAAPESDPVRIKLAFIYCELKQYKKALEHLTRAVDNIDKLTPYQQTAVYYYGAKAYLGTAQKEKALLMMINGVSKEADLPEMHRDFAKYLASWGDAPAKEAVSLEKVTRAAAESPEGKNVKGVANIHNYLLNLLDNKTRYAVALDEFNKYLEKVPGAWDASEIEKTMIDLQRNFAQPPRAAAPARN